MRYLLTGIVVHCHAYWNQLSGPHPPHPYQIAFSSTVHMFRSVPGVAGPGMSAIQTGNCPEGISYTVTSGYVLRP